MIIGRGVYGMVVECVNCVTKERYACKSINVTELLQTADGPNIVGRLCNEVNVMSYLAGHPNVRFFSYL